jgi:aspartyl-tRNA(Asn)/glutamyl-tRNA(Gln) amidotransferase subunit A
LIAARETFGRPRVGTAADAIGEALARAVAEPGIFWSLDRDRALEAAAGVDGGDAAGRLAGVPVGIKDSFDVAGLPTTGGLPRPLHTATADAVVVAALRRAGAIVIGKTAMDQLAWSMSGQAPGRAQLANPVAPDRLAGGSSGGSAAAVAAGIVPVAVATDTAGSVRVPAAWCGVVGFAVSQGHLDLSGCLPLAPGADRVGIVAGSVADTRLALAALDGTASAAVAAAAPRLGVFAEAFAGLDDDEARQAYAAALSCLEASGAELVPLAGLPEAPGFGVILAAEFAASWAGRLEGEDVQPEIAAGIARGAKLSAERVTAARESVAAAESSARLRFEGLDAVVLPTTPLAPAPLGFDPSVRAVSAFTRPFSAFGWPAISLPCGAAAGLPLGLQVAAPDDDHSLLAWAELVESALGAAGGSGR